MRMNRLLPRALALSLALHGALIAVLAELSAPAALPEKKLLAARLHGAPVMRHAASVQTEMRQDTVAPARRGEASRRSTGGEGQKSTMTSPITVLPEHDAVEIRLRLAAALAESAPLSLMNFPVRLDVVWQAGGRVSVQGDTLPLNTHARLLAVVTDVLSGSRAIERAGRLSLEFGDLDASGES